jgi:hypothetical protein
MVAVRLLLTGHAIHVACAIMICHVSTVLGSISDLELDS